MLLKKGVKWPEDMHPSMWMARVIIDDVHMEWTGEVAVCTSAFREQSPGGSSLHPKKRALDIRTWSLGPQDDPVGAKRVQGFAAELRKRLGPDFDVVVEGPAAEFSIYMDRPAHIHVEFDPKGWAQVED